MIIAAVMTLVCVGGAVALALQGGHGGLPLAVTALAFAALLFPYMGFLFSNFSVRAPQRVNRPIHLLALVVAALALHALYAIGTASGNAFDEPSLRLAAFMFAPSLLAAVASARSRPAPSWLDLGVVALIWLPFDTGYLKDIWPWPEGGGAYILNTALALTLACVIFVGVRGLDDVKVRLRWSRADVQRAVISLLAFMVFAIPFGLLTGFIEVHPRADPIQAIGTPLGVFFFIAIPEELLFRGLLQNILMKKLKNRWVGLAIASALFGASHYNNTPTPDWRYLLLATVAGGLYGYNYMKSKSLLGPALLHALVDSVWFLFFMSESMQAGSAR